MRCEEINIRDPFVLVHDGTYYMYGTRSETAFTGQAYGFDVYKSKDLYDWTGPIEVFSRPEGFFSKKCYWAPEVYAAGQRFYMFASFADRRGGLGTAVLAAEAPEGPFRLWSDGYVTPKHERCLDGTLYYTREHKPYLVYCHEWKQIHDGTVCAVPLSEDLRRSTGEARVLFAASSAKPLVRRYFFRNYVTDGPFLLRTEDDRLHMLWSTYGRAGYAEALAHSDNNEITGAWSPDRVPLFGKNGGHGMVFKDLQGGYRLVLHYPNTFRREHPLFTRLEYRDGSWSVG